MWEQATQSGDVLYKLVEEEMYEQIDDDVAILTTDGFQRRPPRASTPLEESSSINIERNRSHFNSFLEALNLFRSETDDDAIIAHVDLTGIQLDASDEPLLPVPIKQEKELSINGDDEGDKENRRDDSSVVFQGETFLDGCGPRMNGYFLCENYYCLNAWHSAQAYRDKWQKCFVCESLNFPYELKPIRKKQDLPKKGRKGHMTAFCQRCKELGHPCTEDRLAQPAAKLSQSTKETYKRLRI